MRTIAIFVVLSFLPLFLKSQVIRTTGKAYRNPVNYSLDSAMIETGFVFEKKSINSRTEGYLAWDLGRSISHSDIEYSIWLISDGNHLYFNSTRHGFKNNYLRFKKNGNYYFFSAQPIFDVYQDERLITAYTFNGWLGVTCAYRRMTYQNEKRRDNVLDLENGTISLLSVDYIYNLVKEYPVLKNEFVNDTTEITLNRLRNYFEGVNEKWKIAKKKLNNL